MIKKILPLLLFLIISAFSTGCSSGSISTFTMGMEKMPDNFDPQTATGSENLTAIENIFYGLFENNNGTIENVIADSYTVSDNKLTYTIKLKSSDTAVGSEYHSRYNKEFDGAKVTADDFVFALQRVLNPKTFSPYAKEFFNIKNGRAVYNGADIQTLGVYSKDDYTLVIELEKPDAMFIEKLCSPAVYPCNREFFESTGGAYGLSIKNVLSNGAFRLNYIDEENATLIRVDGRTGYIDRLRLVEVPAEEQAAAFESEKISCYFSYTAENQNHANSKAMLFDSSVLTLVFNTDMPYLQNENIRRAISWYALGFINSGANLNAVKSTTSLFPGVTTLNGKKLADLYSANLPDYMSLNPKDLYQQGIQELGTSKSDKITLLIPSDSMYSIIYENINQLWQRDLALYCKVEYMPSRQIRSRIDNGNYDIAFVPCIPSNDTPYGILDSFTATDEYVNEYINNLKSMELYDTDISKISEIENYILDKAYCAPMGIDGIAFYYRNNFQNIYVNSFTDVINIKTAKSI